MKKKASARRMDVLFGLALLALFGFSFRRLPFGAVLDDEAFYLSIPWQLVQGGAPLLHQWNPAQFFGVLLAPLLRLYLLLHPSTDGIFLNFRRFFLAAHALTAVFLYVRLRRESRPGAAAVGLFYFVFRFMGFPCLSYKSMSVALMLLACLTMGQMKGKAWEGWLAGAAYAGAVLCCPTLVLLYVLYTAAVVIAALLRRRLPTDLTLRGRTWLRVTAACGVCALLFFLRVDLTGDLRQLGDTIPHLFVLETHTPDGPAAWFAGFCRAFYRSNRWFLPILVTGLALAAAIRFDRGVKKRRWLYLLLAAVVTFFFSLPYLLMYRAHNYLIFPLSILGLYAWMLCEKKDNRLFLASYLPGVVFWACFDMASDLGFASIAGASAVNMPVCLISLFRLFRELAEDAGAGGRGRRVANWTGIAAAAAATFALFLVLIYNTVYRDANTRLRWQDDTAISCGAATGLIARDYEAAEYAAEYAALAPLREIREGNVLFLTTSSLRFLEDSKRCVSNNLWFSYTTPERAFRELEAYWACFPDWRPDYVYLRRDMVEDGYLEGFDSYPHTETDVGTGVILTMDWSTS